MKLTAAIVGAYMPKEVMYNGELRAVYGISAYEVILYNKRDGCEHDYLAYEHCQLILLPFDKISDEDAVEVCKFLYSNPALHNPERGKSVATVGDWHSTRKGVEVIDYLRSKGYDCGHGSIPSLIAAGVAVEKEIV